MQILQKRNSTAVFLIFAKQNEKKDNRSDC